jgi:hypothetical protein
MGDRLTDGGRHLVRVVDAQEAAEDVLVAVCSGVVEGRVGRAGVALIAPDLAELTTTKGHRLGVDRGDFVACEDIREHEVAVSDVLLHQGLIRLVVEVHQTPLAARRPPLCRVNFGGGKGRHVHGDLLR